VRPEQTDDVIGPAEDIRRAILDDIEDLLALDHRVTAGDVQRVSDIRDHVENGHCHVHSESDHLDGYVVVLPRHFLGRDFVDLLIVVPSARRCGIGRKLLGAVLDMEGTSQVFTSSNRSNTPMRELLRQQGWQLSGELDGLDAGDPEMFFFAWRTVPMNWDTGGDQALNTVRTER
jgi:GNAT superfamily N-acetyltransferase